ncbi:MAG: restriction endonuclease subunit S [Desulfobulbus sp.]|nr:restriction endonuclease subunit S [Desulfobulbus sp.]
MNKKTSTWPMLPIGDLLKQVRRPVKVEPDTHYREIGIRSHGKGIFHKPETTGKQIGEKRVFWVEPDCLVFNIVFAWEQAVAMTSKAEVGMIASHRFPMYSSRNGKLLPEYAWRYFSTPRGKYDLNIASPGGAGRNKTLGQAEFKRLKIPVPPIEYQREVVEVLSTTDRAISGMEQRIATNRTLKKGLAQLLLTGHRRLPGFNKQWRNHRLEKISRISKGAGITKEDILPTGLPAVRYGELYTTYDVQIDQVRSFISPEAAKASKAIQYGDLLLAGSGEDRTEIGKAAVYLGQETAYAGGDVIIVTPAAVNSVFLAYLLDSQHVRRAFYCHAQGESVVHIYMRDVASLKLLLPPLDEQSRIAAVLSAADREIVLLEKKLAAQRKLKKGLMQKLLTGTMPTKETA